MRTAVDGDLAALAEARADEDVRRWWGAPSADDFDPPEDGALLVIEVDGAIAGSIQYEEVTDPQYRSAGIDIFLAGAVAGPRARPRGSSACSCATSSRRAATTG